MKLEELADIKNLHHAYLVTGSADDVLALLNKRGIETTGNPDVLALTFSELLVDDVRDTILPFAALKPLGERKYIIIAFSRANDHAQNALLKAVEESLGQSVFFLCVESAGHVLPTLKSRCIFVSASVKKAEAANEEAESFVTGSFEKRLSVVEKMTSAISKTQDRTSARAFVRALVTHYHARGAAPSVLRDLLSADRYMHMQGGSAKAVLSHLAVSLPRK